MSPSSSTDARLPEGDGDGDGSVGWVDVLRGGVVESRHRVHVAVVDADGILQAGTGDPSLSAFVRSAAKPFQALPLVEDGVADALGLTDGELALCSASHNAEDAHLDGVRSILRKAEIDVSALECGPHEPMLGAAARRLTAAGETPVPIHNNCSGKHAGMLALARHHGWPLAGYVAPDHPVQRRMLDEMARWSGVDVSTLATATDGCGVVCFGLPLRAMARAWARLGRAASDGDEGPARVLDAMAAHPFMVAGTDRLCTAVMEEAGDRVVVKTGAEGVYCGVVRHGPAAGLGVALKVEDGARRASDAALMRVLELLDVLDDRAPAGPLARFRRPEVRNTLGSAVGAIVADFELREPTVGRRGEA